MYLWLLLAGVLTIQESFSTTLVVLEAVHANYPVVLIHSVWFFVTLSETYFGYIFGTWLQGRRISRKLDSWIGKHTTETNNLIGRSGKGVTLAFLTILIFPFFTGFIAPWLSIPVSDALIFSQAGSLLWYVTVWIGVYGANQFSSTLETSVITIAVVSLLLTIPLVLWRKRHRE